MEKKRDSIDKMLTGRGEALERDIAKYRETGASLSPAERAGREQTLMARQQELMELRDKMLEGLGEDEKKINESLQTNLLTFLKEYNQKHGYDFILGYQPGGGILFANDSLDVTLDVVKGLNTYDSK